MQMLDQDHFDQSLTLSIRTMQFVSLVMNNFYLETHTVPTHCLCVLLELFLLHKEMMGYQSIQLVKTSPLLLVSSSFTSSHSIGKYFYLLSPSIKRLYLSKA